VWRKGEIVYARTLCAEGRMGCYSGWESLLQMELVHPHPILPPCYGEAIEKDRGRMPLLQLVRNKWIPDEAVLVTQMEIIVI